jgi:hypothetical protein
MEILPEFRIGGILHRKNRTETEDPAHFFEIFAPRAPLGFQTNSRLFPQDNFTMPNKREHNSRSEVGL